MGQRQSLVLNYVTKRHLYCKMTEACIKGDLDTVKCLLNNFDSGHIYKISTYACIASEHGHLHILKWFVQKYNFDDLESIAYAACLYNKMDIMKYILQSLKYSDVRKYNIYYYSWKGSCHRGDLTTLVCIITNGVTLDTDEVNKIIYHAAYGGNMDILTLCLSLVPGYKTNSDGTITLGVDDNHKIEIFNECMHGACDAGDINIVKFAINNGATDCNTGMKLACKYNHLDIVDLMINYDVHNWNDYLLAACSKSKIDKLDKSDKDMKLELVKRLILHGANNWNESFIEACGHGDIEIVKLLIGHGANDFNRGLVEACTENNVKIVNLLLDLGATAWDKGFRASYEKQNINLMNLMARKGPVNFHRMKPNNIDDFKLMLRYCLGTRKDPKTYPRCIDLLKTYPVYVLLTSKIECRSKYTTGLNCLGTNRHVPNDVSNNHVKKLPWELLRLLHQYL